MSEDEDSSSVGLPYTVRHLADHASSTEDESLSSLPPLPKRFSHRASASPYRTVDRISASQRLQLAQRSRSNLGTIHEDATSKKPPTSRSRLLPSRETVSQQSSHPSEDIGQQRGSIVSSIDETANNSTHRSSSATDATIDRETPSTSTKTNESQTMCAICHETILIHQKYFLPCFHVFHQHCIDDCFQHVLPTNPKRCPTCRFIVHPAQSGVVDMTITDDTNVAETESEPLRTRTTNVGPQSYTIPTMTSIDGLNEVTVRPSNNVINRSPVPTTTTRATATVNSARAPRRRPAPTSTTTEQPKRRSTTFTQSQINTLLDLCDEMKPIGEQGWKLVTESFLIRFPSSNKTWKGLRQKFNKLANIRFVSFFNLFDYIKTYFLFHLIILKYIIFIVLVLRLEKQGLIPTLPEPLRLGMLCLTKTMVMTWRTEICWTHLWSETMSLWKKIITQWKETLEFKILKYRICQMMVS